MFLFADNFQKFLKDCVFMFIAPLNFAKEMNGFSDRNYHHKRSLRVTMLFKLSDET
jgi:hypothetical protein